LAKGREGAKGKKDRLGWGGGGGGGGGGSRSTLRESDLEKRRLEKEKEVGELRGGLIIITCRFGDNLR